jgi:cytochrome b561
MTIHWNISWADGHGLFGAVLCCSILVQFAWQLRNWRLGKRPDYRRVGRRLSRQIYLALYLLSAVRELQYLVVWLVDSRVAVGSLPSMGDSMKDLQCYVGYGFLALVDVRLLTNWCQYEFGSHLKGSTA